jgi:hypothetical protein
MTDFLDYKPNLEYTYEDIDTIDNTTGADLLSGKLIIKNTGAEATQALDEAIEEIEDAILVMKDGLKEQRVPMSGNRIDDMAAIYIGQHPDGKVLMDKGFVTYQMYEYARDIPALEFVAYNWEMHQAGPEGSLEGELISQLLLIKEEAMLARDLVDKVVNYDKKYKNINDLKEKELLEIEHFLNMDRRIDELYLDESSTMEDINDARKSYFEKKAKLELKKSVSKYSKRFAKDVKSIAKLAKDSLDTKKRQDEARVEQEKLEKFSKKTGIGTKKAKFLIYQSHKSKRDQIVSANQDMKTARRLKAESYRNMVTSMRAYMDIAVQTLNELEHTPVEDTFGIGEMLNGAEVLTRNMQSALMEYSNEGRVSTHLIRNQIKRIITKDKVRSIYKNF